MTAARPGGQRISTKEMPKRNDGFPMTQVQALGFLLIVWACYPIIKPFSDNLAQEMLK